MKKISITRKESRAKYDAIMFCIKALDKPHCGNREVNLLCIKKDHVVATDGHRLHYVPMSGIPVGLYEYSKKKTTITLKLRIGEVYRYPDYKRVIPETFMHETEVNNAELASLCRSAKIISSNMYMGVRLTFDKYLKVEMNNPDIGNMWGETKISSPVKPKFEIALNVHYLIDSLKGLGKQVVIKLQEKENDPLIFRDVKEPFGEDDGKMALIMPMRL